MRAVDCRRYLTISIFAASFHLLYSCSEINRPPQTHHLDFALSEIVQLSRAAYQGNPVDAQNLANFFAGKMDLPRAVYWYKKAGHKNLGEYEIASRKHISHAISHSGDHSEAMRAKSGDEQSLINFYMAALHKKEYAEAREWNSIGQSFGFSWSTENWNEILLFLETIEASGDELILVSYPQS